MCAHVLAFLRVRVRLYVRVSLCTCVRVCVPRGEPPWRPQRPPLRASGTGACHLQGGQSAGPVQEDGGVPVGRCAWGGARIGSSGFRSELKGWSTLPTSCCTRMGLDGVPRIAAHLEPAGTTLFGNGVSAGVMEFR